MVQRARMPRTYDLVLFGATGFTGRLVAEYLLANGSHEGPLRWALAGRDTRRLEALRSDIGAGNEVAVLTADAADPAAMRELAAQTRVMLTTVGPYQRLGEPLVTACAQAGTDCVDLCGEPLWMAQMIPVLQAPAQASGARIVFSCGFDSVPFDLGVVFLQHEMHKRFDAPALEVRGRVKLIKGSMSGGTAASALATYEAMGKDKALAALMDNPFALTPGFEGPEQADDAQASFDEWAQAWSAPFVMSAINTKNVHRTHALRDWPWGHEFRYSERELCGEGEAGWARAKSKARQFSLSNLLLKSSATRALLRRFALPKPGEGPSARQRERGRYELHFTGQTASGQRLTVRVCGDRDPGYGSTCQIISQAALCLLRDVNAQATPGGVWTAGAAMGMALQRRLQVHAGLTFEVMP